MQKLILSAALVCGIIWNASAQNTKTTTKVKTPAASSTTTTTTNQNTNAGAVEETNTTTSSSTSFLQRNQSNGNGGDIKAAGGEITLEANVNPFNGNQVSLSNSLNQVRARYFLSDNLAARLGAHLSFNTTVPAPDAKTRAIEFSIAPGLERHFEGTNRLSPYIGAELVLGLRSAHYELDGPGSEGTEIKGGFTPGGTADRGFFLVGVGALGGFDFYVAKHLYIGYELSMELSNRSYSEVETITTSATGTVTTIRNEGTSAFSFGPNVRNGIRVGFVF